MQTWQVEPSPGADVGGVSPVPVPMWRLSPAGVAAAAVPESVHSLPVQLAVQLHSNEPTAIDSTSPATPKSSRHAPLSKSVHDLVIESAAGARCPIGCAARYYGNAAIRRVQRAAYAACACQAMRARNSVCAREHVRACV